MQAQDTHWEICAPYFLQQIKSLTSTWQFQKIVELMPQMIHNNEPRWPNGYASELRRPGAGGPTAKAKSIPGGRRRQVEKYSNSYHNISFLPDPMAV